MRLAGVLLIAVDDLGLAKINQLDVVVRRKHDVGRFDVPVSIILLVQVLECDDDLSSVELNDLFFESPIAVFLNEFFKSAVWNVFHDHVEVFFIGKRVIQIGQKEEVLAVLQDVFLSFHVWHLPSFYQEVPGQFLDGILFLVVARQVDLSIRAFS